MADVPRPVACSNHPRRLRTIDGRKIISQPRSLRVHNRVEGTTVSLFGSTRLIRYDNTMAEVGFSVKLDEVCHQSDLMACQ